MLQDAVSTWSIIQPGSLDLGGISGSSGRLDRFDELGLSVWDRRILVLARRKLGGVKADFGEALRALREAVEESIPAGRVFLLGTGEDGPIVGSIISGVGIVDGMEGVSLVRVDREGRRTMLGRFAP